MIDLSVRYLGLELRNPLIASASPLTRSIDNLRELERHGIGAVVLPSLFEEQIEHEEMAIEDLHWYGRESSAEALDYRPPLPSSSGSSQQYLDLIWEAKNALKVPVIASLNGTSVGGWLKYAQAMADAGADAIELNVYLVPTDFTITGAEIESRIVDLVLAVRGSISIPLSVKVGASFSSVANMMFRLVSAGADGLVLFNRFLQPDIDLENLKVDPKVTLSNSDEIRLPLRWIGILRREITASLAATSGVHSVDDAVKLLLVGADAVMMTSALLKHGPAHVAKVRRDLEDWLVDHEYESVAQMRGSMCQAHYGDPLAFERANYMNALVSYQGPHV